VRRLSSLPGRPCDTSCFSAGNLVSGGSRTGQLEGRIDIRIQTNLSRRRFGKSLCCDAQYGFAEAKSIELCCSAACGKNAIDHGKYEAGSQAFHERRIQPGSAVATTELAENTVKYGVFEYLLQPLPMPAELMQAPRERADANGLPPDCRKETADPEMISASAPPHCTLGSSL
jgi:hypothetical protein